MTVATEHRDRSVAGPTTITAVDDPVSAAEATALLLDHAEWVRLAAAIDLQSAQPDFAAEVAALAGGSPDRTVFLARRAGTTVGTVSVRVHDDGTAELKRMYVRPVARGTGIADLLVHAAIDEARARGCDVLWLETHPVAMARAVSVYRRCGFVEADPAKVRLAVPGVIVMEQRLGPCR